MAKTIQGGEVFIQNLFFFLSSPVARKTATFDFSYPSVLRVPAFWILMKMKNDRTKRYLK